MKKEERCWALVPAAGRGIRVHAERPKQYLPLAGKTVVEHALAVLLEHPRISGLAVAIAPGDAEWPRHAPRTDKPLLVADGGAERCHSVRNALERLRVLADDGDWVLVHDAARPCLHREDLDRLIAAVEGDAVGGLLAVPLNDTLKQAGEDGRVAGTVDRRQLWRALTPQMFRAGMLRAALDAAFEKGLWPTDESAAMEAAGHAPRLVAGREDNIKITRREDLAFAEAVLAQRHKGMT
ncbi:MAG TPA: 2-C-methyl-D-erythritol 4-phosphate cytidylyltransferase [Gammaproteobacteria bacterium]|nr:2-C-methyl-D-erythritol 4-phosphate cytidylyltransferase [Gammaproteobacteria bacterium]